MLKRNSVYVRLFLIFLAAIFLLAVYGFGVNLFVDSRRTHRVPLSKIKLDSLCNQLGFLSEELCKSQQLVYPSAFLPSFKRKFPIGQATYKMVFDTLNSGSLRIIEPTASYYDLAGNGANPIFIWSDYNGVIRSIVITRRNVVTTLDSGTVQDLCKLFDLPDTHTLCIRGTVVSSQDFFPIIERTFPLGQVRINDVYRKGIDQYKKVEKLLRPRSDFFLRLENFNSTLIRMMFWNLLLLLRITTQPKLILKL